LRNRRCLVCGRVFPEGQGIVIAREGLVLEFHSSRCAARFMRKLFEESEEFGCIKKAAEKIMREFEKSRELEEKEKKI